MGSPVPAPSPHYCLASPRHKKIPYKKMADTVELQEAFKLFDMDGDGMITKDELRKLVEKVGGKMTEGEAKGLIHQADKDGNESIDFSEFSKLWARARARSGRSSASWTRTTADTSPKTR